MMHHWACGVGFDFAVDFVVMVVVVVVCCVWLVWPTNNSPRYVFNVGESRSQRSMPEAPAGTVVVVVVVVVVAVW